MEKGIDLTGFIISSKTVQKQIVLELPVHSIYDFKAEFMKDKGIIVGVSKKLQCEIISVLESIGITDYYCVDDNMIDNMISESSYNHHYSSKNNITVFCYHRVADLPIDTWGLTVSPRLFEMQVKYIKRNYTILRSEGSWELPEGKRGAIITFDDGYEDAYTNVRPILEKHGVPATFFICSCNIGNKNEFWWDELERILFFSERKRDCFLAFGNNLYLRTDDERKRACYTLHPYLKKMDYKDRRDYLKILAKELNSTCSRDYCHSMNGDQLRKLSDSRVVTIGGHTVTHSCLACETSEMQDYEIKQSKEDIEHIIGKRIEVFSYPFGQADDFTDETIEIANKYGYKRIFAAYTGITSNHYINGYIPRVDISPTKDYDKSIKLLRYYETIYDD